MGDMINNKCTAAYIYLQNIFENYKRDNVQYNSDRMFLHHICIHFEKSSQVNNKYLRRRRGFGSKTTSHLTRVFI